MNPNDQLSKEERAELLDELGANGPGFVVRIASAVGTVFGVSGIVVLFIGALGGTLAFWGCLILLILKTVGVDMSASFESLAVTGMFGFAVSWFAKMVSKGISGRS